MANQPANEPTNYHKWILQLTEQEAGMRDLCV